MIDQFLWHTGRLRNAAKLNNIGIFGEASWEITPQVITTVGLRVDDHTRVGTNASPRFAINYLPNEREMFRFAVLSGYRLPNTIESEISEGFFVSADPDLEAETIATIELPGKASFPNKPAKIGANVFFNHVEGEMWFIPHGFRHHASNYQSWLNDRLLEVGSGNPPDLSIFPGPFFEYDNNDLRAIPLALNSLSTTPFKPPITDYAPGPTSAICIRRLEDDFIYASAGFDTNAPEISWRQ